MVKTCKTMDEVRTEIDRLDQDIVSLLADRQKYVVQAGEIKPERSMVRDPERIEDVVAKVSRRAEDIGLDVQLIDDLYRRMIERFIEIEYSVYDADQKGE